MIRRVKLAMFCLLVSIVITTLAAACNEELQMRLTVVDNRSHATGEAGLEPPPATPSVLHLAQDHRLKPARPLSTEEWTSLGDPLFRLVLRDAAHVTTLSGLEALLRPSATSVFVVGEHIAVTAEGSAAQGQDLRRAVITYQGQTDGETLTDNIMLSLFFNSAGFPDQPHFIEAWGWDSQRNRYNYYIMDRVDTTSLNGPEFSWKFRNSSEQASTMSVQERQGTCLACHINGAPIMKELRAPWNNWHSAVSPAPYLLQGPNAWDILEELEAVGTIQNADTLESRIRRSIRRFNTGEINRGLADGPTPTGEGSTGGLQTVVEGKRLLRPLFETTEFNTIAAGQKSGMLPFAPTGPGVLPIQIPPTFLLNAKLLSTGGIEGYQGLHISGIEQPITLEPAEYALLLNEFAVRFDNKVGDADFAWLVPEASHSDVDWADQLLRRGIVTPHFLAAVLAIELDRPLLSHQRSELYQYMPDQFPFVPLPPDTVAVAQPYDRSQDFLTQAVIEAIRAADPPPASVAAEFLALLESDYALPLLEAEVHTYLAGIRARLDADETRAAELTRLYARAIEVRRAVAEDESLGVLDETGGRMFFPVSASP